MLPTDVFTQNDTKSPKYWKRNISLFQDLDGFVSFFVNTCVGRVSYRHGSISEKLTYSKKFGKYNRGMH